MIIINIQTYFKICFSVEIERICRGSANWMDRQIDKKKRERVRECVCVREREREREMRVRVQERNYGLVWA